MPTSQSSSPGGRATGGTHRRAAPPRPRTLAAPACCAHWAPCPACCAPAFRPPGLPPGGAAPRHPGGMAPSGSSNLCTQGRRRGHSKFCTLGQRRGHQCPCRVLEAHALRGPWELGCEIPGSAARHPGSGSKPPQLSLQALPPFACDPAPHPTPPPSTPTPHASHAAAPLPTRLPKVGAGDLPG